MKISGTKLKNPLDYIIYLAKWLVLSAIVGLAGGAVGSVFHIAIDFVTELRVKNPHIILFLPLGGIVIAWIYHFFKSKGRLDTNRVIEAVTSEEKVPLVLAPLIFAGTLITHLFGGSAGREGAALQLGGSIGYNTGKLFGLKKDNLHIIVMSGMSAVFAALFGTPVTAAFFSLEVACVGVMHYAALVPAVASALVASFIAKSFGLHPVHFGGISPESAGITAIFGLVALSVLCALVSILFCMSIKKCEHILEGRIKSRYMRSVVGAIIIVALSYLLSTRDYNGAGMDVVQRALDGKAFPLAFLIKIVFTSLTIAAGFKGGEIVPAFFIGSTFGCVAAPFLGLDPSFAASVGFVAVFCAVVNCPVAALVLAIEVFGSENILLYALACAISYMMSGYSGLYKSQKFIFSKLDESEIQKNTI